MRRSWFGPIVAAIALALPVLSIQAGEKEQLDDKIQHVNDLAKKPGARDVAVQRVSVETGVPVDRVQAMHQKHSDIGIGGVLVANVLADETKKDPELFMKQRGQGKKWAAIAKENNVSFSSLNDRLDRLERAIGTPEKTPEKAQEKKNKRKG
jgi:hypothetical protein